MIATKDTGESQQKAGLRRAASAVEGALATLSSEMVGDRARLGGLLSSWTQMLEQLDLGPAPEIRPCPFCGATAMRAATRCGNCWSALTPVAAREEI